MPAFLVFILKEVLFTGGRHVVRSARGERAHSDLVAWRQSSTGGTTIGSYSTTKETIIGGAPMLISIFAESSMQEFNAYFYSLVSQDTLEMAYARKRQSFLVDQGYAYKVRRSCFHFFSVTFSLQVVTEIDGMSEAQLLLSTKEERTLLLHDALMASDAELTIEAVPEQDDDWEVCTVLYE